MKPTRILALSLLATASLLSACQASSSEPLLESGTGYGLTHGHYVGVATVETSDGLVTEITLDEYFLPYNWAKVVVADVNAIPEDVLTVVGTRGTSYYAEFIKIGDKLFTGAVEGASGSQHILYSADDVEDIELWVETEENALWYVEQIEAEAFYLADAAGEESTLVRGDATSNVAMTKSESGYWSGENYPLGWAGNIDAIKEAFIGTRLDFTIESTDKTSATETEPAYWIVGGETTGATLTDFLDYYQLLQRAYANREALAE